MKVYGFPTFNLAKVLFTAEEVFQPYEIEWINPAKGEQKRPDYLRKQPLGKVPCLELEGEYFFESNSICRLLAQLHGPQLIGQTPQEQARVNQWIDFSGFHAGRWMAVYYFNDFIKPTLFRQPGDPNAIAEAKHFLAEQLPIIEHALSSRPYIATEQFSIADIILFSYCLTHEVSTLSFAHYPAITEWYQRIRNRPTFLHAEAKVPGGSMFG